MCVCIVSRGADLPACCNMHDQLEECLCVYHSCVPLLLLLILRPIFSGLTMTQEAGAGAA